MELILDDTLMFAEHGPSWLKQCLLLWELLLLTKPMINYDNAL